jgi:ribonuclease HI
MMTSLTFGKSDGNQAEMLRTATLAALNRTLSESVESGSKVSLYINCGYVRDVLIQKRYQQWQQNNWETEQGRPVAEADLWKKLLALLNIMDVQPVQKSVWEQNYEIAKKLLQVAEFNASSPKEN